MPRRVLGSGGLRLAIGFAVVAFVVAFGPLLWSGAADELNVANANAGASSAHWLGTDQLGRDVLSRTLVAAQLSMVLAVLAALTSVAVGTVAGIGLVMAPRRVRAAGLRMVDALQAFPAILLAIVIAAILDPGAVTALVAIGLASAPGVARLTSNVAGSEIERDHVKNAQVVGVSGTRIFLRYLLPPVLRSLGITATYDVGLNLVSLASLSFLGLGIQLPQYDWGRLLKDGITAINLNVWTAIAPALAITVAGALFAALGEVLSRRGSRTSSASRGSRVRTPQPVAADEARGETATDDVVVVDGLTVRYPGAAGPAVDDVGITVRKGEIVGIIGESGSGKSTLAFALAHLLSPGTSMTARRATVVGADVMNGGRHAIDEAFRHEVAVVFQEPMSSLNPTMAIGRQLTESLRVGGRTRRQAARQRALDVLGEVRVTHPALRLVQRPFELSGGMRQRVLIAMAVACRPRLLVADEPTTALDATVQAQIMALLTGIVRETGAALLLISHDLGLVAEYCSRAYVMYAGRVVETGAVAEVLERPRHPYTRALVDCRPAANPGARRLVTIPGSVPAVGEAPAGCRFAPRCPLVVDACRETDPRLRPVDGVDAACLRAEVVSA